MAFRMAQKEESDLYCPMIDARRMEVYNAFYNSTNKEIRGIQADIIEACSYQNELDKKVLIFGDGSEKCKQMIQHPNARFIDGIFPSSKDMLEIANEKFAEKDFEDVVYFEPFYLKDFVAGKKD